MKVVRVIDPSHPMYERAKQLYKESFPLHEQREELSQTKILRDPAYHFSLLYDNNRYVGLALYWETDSYLYVEHLCILPEMRNKQYGQQALALLAELKKTVILEIDPPVDEVSVRRKGFYERNGFCANPFPHVHPPYHKGNCGHNLVVMSYPNQLTVETYDSFYDYLCTRIMADAF